VSIDMTTVTVSPVFTLALASNSLLTGIECDPSPFGSSELWNEKPFRVL
jgi:hypothetical protein